MKIRKQITDALDIIKTHMILLTIVFGYLLFMLYIVAPVANKMIPKHSEVAQKVVYETVYIEKEQVDHDPYYHRVSESMSESEYKLLAALTKEEAGNQSYAGQRAVVEVVCNRVLDPRFPDTVTDVIYEEGQFSTSKMLKKSEPTQEQYDAVDAVLREVEPILPADVVYFANRDTGRPVYEKIGAHYFFYG